MFPALVPIPPELELAKCRAAQPEALLNRGGRLTRVGGRLQGSCLGLYWERSDTSGVGGSSSESDGGDREYRGVHTEVWQRSGKEVGLEEG